MKKKFQFMVILLIMGLLWQAYPFFEVAVGAPARAVDALGITKSDGVSQVKAGDGVTYTYVITLTNVGATRIRGVVVTDTWPVGFTRVAVTPSKGSCDTQTSPTNFTCDIGNINALSQETISVDYRVPAGTAAGTYTNTADATAEEGSPPVTVSDVNNVVTEADVRLLTKDDDLDPVNTGQILTYSLSMTNFGPSNASGVVLTDNLPAGTQYQDSLSTASCSGPAAGPVTCALGTIASGSPRQVTIKVLVTSSTPGTIHNVANVTTTTTDPNLDNNGQSEDTTVVVDVTKPTVSWVDPVAAEEYAYLYCRPNCEPVHLSVQATDDSQVERVHFFRWDHVILDYVDIGDDFTNPYTWEFDPNLLPLGINQIYAQAYDIYDHASDRKRIFLFKQVEILMPLVGK